ncbi:MAG: DUF1638 domain-containing protein [Deltaproteobacteria bacterium]|jgi:hypothetical protein|nr:DUF1638 domain-containing protein [Deltaproteobacteria bacterium]
MKTVLMACETIRAEIGAGMESLGLSFPAHFLPGGLHNSPEKLSTELQNRLQSLDGRCERLLLALGYCGGGAVNVRAGDFEIILPLADDCLTFLLGSREARLKASQPPTFFLTGGWLEHENNIVSSFERTLKEFDPETAFYLNKAIYQGYARLGIVDTGGFDARKAALKVRPMAEALGLKVETLRSDDGWLKTFLRGPYDDPKAFIRVPPRGRLSFGDWGEIFK